MASYSEFKCVVRQFRSVMVALLLVCLAKVATASATAVERVKVTEAITNAAAKYKLERNVLSCVLRIESSYRLAIVSITHDYGIGQINVRTIKGYNFSKGKLLTDLSYSVNAAAEVLSAFKREFKRDEPTNWVARYNVGYQSLTTKGIGAAYVTYNAKVQRCLVERMYL